ncbi:HAD family hydrolase [Jiangella rhizosphaerae]|uniref:HAD family hydrolase n=1 Tax=Jiangella rhizosphaerae TaxID=2293569 RepID=A0A418KGJ2_9ACTN|nr:HAD-IA family hydrolase [Jiangella rhizosphaerae]RIQ11119.1 HAD family hydrolase [Jiangella rhizosphaerae]
MTASTSEQLGKLLSGVELLMLDFDGPVCSVFAGLPASDVAVHLRAVLRHVGVSTTVAMEQDDDPLSIYRRSEAYGEMVTLRIYDDLVAAEVRAIASAKPTPGALEVVEVARATGRQVAIVSNNAAAAVEAYIKRHTLTKAIDYVAARRTPQPALMKPNAAYLVEAAHALGVPASQCVLVGDSTTDIEAARHARMSAIGYANKPGKAARLIEAGADGLIEQMIDLADALRR